MGGHSSGGSDNNVSGNEAVYTGGKTYSSKKTKTVNKEIADQNKANRDSRKGIAEKIFEKTLLGQVTNKVSNSKFVQDTNYKKRMKFAEDKGLDTSKFSRDFVLSKGFKNQLDGYGYSKTVGDTKDDSSSSQKSIEQPKVAAQMDNSDVKSDLITAKGPTSVEMSADDILLQNKRKGRKRTVLTSVTGVEGYPTLSKKTLLGG